MKKVRILITGSEGVLGKPINIFLRDREYSVMTLDIAGNPDCYCDVMNADLFMKIVYRFKPNIVLHLAARTDPASSFLEMDEDIMTNVIGTRNVLEYLAKEGGLIIFTSSCAVYGDAFRVLNRPVLEEDAGAFTPVSPYGVNKLAAENYVRLYKKFGVDYAILRLGNIYSEFDNHYLLWRLFISDNEPFRLYGDGKMVRDFCYVGDLCNLLLLIIDVYSEGRWRCGVYNVGHEPIEVKEIVDRFVAKYGYPKSILREEKRIGEFETMVLDTRRVRNLGWVPNVKMFDEGMDRCVKGFRERCGK
jgi:UDP-glucose 4-epimerase